MSLWQRALVARQIIGKQLNVLHLICGRAAAARDVDRACQRLRRWQVLTAACLTDHVSPEIGQAFTKTGKDVAAITDLDTLSHARLVYQTFLYRLLEELKYSPENVLPP
jgi:hypothetical protein